MTYKKELQTQTQNDGWNNVITGLGGDKAKNPGADFSRGRVLTEKMLEDLYVFDGFGRKIIDKIAKDMTREWIRINGDADDKILTKLNQLKAKKKFSSLIKWAKLYGGAVILMGINDGGTFDEPVNENRIKSIDFLHVLDRQFVFFQNENVYNDPADPMFGEPQFYTITASAAVASSNTLSSKILNIFKTKTNASGQFVVHESRILRMDGVELPLTRRRDNNTWGASIFEAAWKQLSNVGQAYEYTAEAVHRMVQDIIKLKGLTALLQRGKDGEKIVIDRLKAVWKCRSWFNGVVMDTDEEYETDTMELTTLPAIIDKFTIALCAVIDMPESVLMGRTPSGLNASGEDDLSSWYNTIKSEQTDNLYPVLHRLVSLIIKSREMPSNINSLASGTWDVVFKSLEQANPIEEGVIKKTQAETDQLYIQIGVLDPDEVRDSRFGGGNYSTETELQERPPEPEEPEDQPDVTMIPGNLQQQTQQQAQINSANNPEEANAGNTNQPPVNS